MLWLWISTSALAADLVVDVGDDWCATLTTAVAGDRVLLAAGTHTGTCRVTPAGTADSPITLTAQDLERRATLTATDPSANLLDLDGGHIVIEGLDFGPTEVNVEAIRLHAGESVTVRDCGFAFIGGQSIVANTAGAAYSGLTIEDNTFTDVTGSAVTIGCYAGSVDCAATDVTVHRNRIAGVSSGDGVVLEADSVGSIVRNTISGTSGPAVRVSGDVAELGGVEAPTEGGEPSTVVERNHLVGSGASMALVVDGGPALIRNNVVVSGAAGGLSVADPTGNNRMDHIHVLGNSITGTSGPAVTLVDWVDGNTLAFANNGVWDALAPGAGVPAAIGTLPWGGNVDCSTETVCFENITAGDPSPRAGGELVGQGVVPTSGFNGSDLCGDARVVGSASGALIGSLADPFSTTDDADPTVHCVSGGPDTGDTGSEPDTGGDTDTDIVIPGTPGGGVTDTGLGPSLPRWSAAFKAGEAGGVSCSTAGAATGWVAIVLGLIVSARRREDVEGE
jgi:MYXO-CTERM domain-containing protein